MPLTMMQKRTDFASFLTTILQAHDAEFTIDTTERRELEQNVDRKSRLKITAAGDSDGKAEKYCLIRDTGQIAVINEGMDSEGNVDCFIGHRFRVQIFYEKNYTTSQAAFETIVYADRSASPAGLLDSIRAARTRTVSGEVYEIGLITGDAFESVQRGLWDFGANGGKPELVHYLEFEVILI